MHAIPKKWKKVIKECDNPVELEYQTRYGELLEHKKWMKIVYASLNESESALKHMQQCLENIIKVEFNMKELKLMAINVNRCNL